jgi:hypothetical protein
MNPLCSLPLKIITTVVLIFFPGRNPEEFKKDRQKTIANRQHPSFPTLAKGGKGGFSNSPVLVASMDH